LFNLQSTKGPDTSADVDARSQIQIVALRRGQGRFPTHCKVSDESLSHLTMFGTEFANDGINLVVIAPPITSALLKELKSVPTAHAHLTQWRKRLNEAWPQTYDFTDPRSINSSDCEFDDGIYGCEVAYAQIFCDLAKSENERLKKILNVKKLDQVITIDKNKTTIALGFSKEIRNIELGGFKTYKP